MDLASLQGSAEDLKVTARHESVCPLQTFATNGTKL